MFLWLMIVIDIYLIHEGLKGVDEYCRFTLWKVVFTESVFIYIIAVTRRIGRADPTPELGCVTEQIADLTTLDQQF